VTQTKGFKFAETFDAADFIPAVEADCVRIRGDRFAAPRCTERWPCDFAVRIAFKPFLARTAFLGID